MNRFVFACTQWTFLSTIIGSYHYDSSFAVPVSYDYSKSTSENYLNTDQTDFVGDFVDYRKKVSID